MVKQTSLWLGVLGILSSVSVLVFLVSKSLPIEAEEHQKYWQALKQEREENSLLSEQIIQSKYELLSSYNLSTDRFNKFQKNQENLLIIPAFITNKDRREIQNIIKNYSQILERQQDLVTQFRTENSIIKNSLGYLLVLTNDLHNNLSYQNWNANLVLTMDEILQNLILYNMTSDSHLVPVISSKIARLKQLQAQKGLGSQDILTKAIITHGTLIVEHKNRFDELTQQLRNLNVDEYIQELISVYSNKYENALTRVNYYQFLLVTITIAYLIINNLTKTNRSMIRLLENFTEELESKVEARTAELATSMYEAEKARVKAEEANKAKSRFLANMSHELRTPLNAVLGFTQIISRDRSLSDDNQNNLGIISRSGEHLLKLINDILEMSKIEVGQITLNKNSFDLDRLLDSLEEMFRLKANSKNLQLLFEKAENLPLYISTDEGKLTQILINLLGNALKFTEEGGVMLRVDFRPSTTIEGLEVSTFNHLYFEIEDTGAGIAADEIDKLFIPFEQTATGRKSQEGTVLGLPISQRYIQLMGGELSVKTTLGRGTIFSFSISIELVENTEEIYGDRKSKILGLEPEQPEYRILAVDDRHESRLLFTSDSFSVMSLEWLEQFLQAAEKVDNKQLFELIEQIPPEYVSTANTLTDLVRNFRCDKIIDLIEKIKV